MSIQNLLKTITINNEIKYYCEINIPIILDFFKVADFISTDHLKDYLDIHLLNHNLSINKLIQGLPITNVKNLTSVIDNHKNTIEQIINKRNNTIIMKALYQNYDKITLQWDTLSKEHKSLYTKKEEYIHGLLLFKEHINEETNLAYIKEYHNLLKYYSSSSETPFNIDISDFINNNYKLIHNYITPYKKNIILINKEIVNTIIYPIVLKFLNLSSAKHTEKDLNEIKEYLHQTYCIVDGFSNLEILLNDKQNNKLTNIIANLFSVEGLTFSETISLIEKYNAHYTPYNKLSKLLQTLYIDESSYSYYIKFYTSLNNTSKDVNQGNYVYNIFSSIYKESKNMVNTIINTPYFMVFLSIMVVIYYLNNKNKIKTARNRVTRIEEGRVLLKKAKDEKQYLLNLLSENPNNLKLKGYIGELENVVIDLDKKIKYQEIKHNGDYKQHQSYKAEYSHLKLNDYSQEKKILNESSKRCNKLLKKEEKQQEDLFKTEEKNNIRSNRQKRNNTLISKIDTILVSNGEITPKYKNRLLELQHKLKTMNFHQQNKIDNNNNNTFASHFKKLNDCSEIEREVNKLEKQIINTNK